ncbi:GNAT family N-acetyltransferase [Riemerella columbipharyngis]|uniref:Ribosomal protein S18 acetylase RimI n=1 Tax=Riemerella columbipharyngis TaxID=1071918 RepID=A0A1G7CZ73_9FLAO|nr:GNAT family N-acetyltransferase [Riemerella columbipharyngis]SDE44533.1 Ribosomal protein S18 acetylase RimI [Riemerella columbipharyngis]
MLSIRDILCKDVLAQEIYQCYCRTFPPDERRDEGQFFSLFVNEKVEVLSIHHKDAIVGYLIIWHLQDFVFLEHFEIFSHFRGQGLGSEVLQLLKNEYRHIVLESEPDSLSKIAKKRIEFYQRNSFRIIDENYIQPPYSKDKNALPLFLLANFSDADKAVIKENIYTVVYNQDKKSLT